MFGLSHVLKEKKKKLSTCLCPGCILGQSTKHGALNTKIHIVLHAAVFCH